MKLTLMVSASARNSDSKLIKSTLDWIAEVGINGLGFLQSAERVAEDNLNRTASVDDAIVQLLHGELHMLLAQASLLA